jgi:hypothetical protein
MTAQEATAHKFFCGVHSEKPCDCYRGYGKRTYKSWAAKQKERRIKLRPEENKPITDPDLICRLSYFNHLDPSLPLAAGQQPPDRPDIIELAKRGLA